MIQNRHSFLVLLGTILFLVPPGNSSGEIVFDNTEHIIAVSFGPGCCTTGLEVNLDGTNRILTQVGWLFDGQTGVESADIELGVYANDGPDGAPETLLWSDLIEDLELAPGRDLYSFSVPNIEVPDTITVTSFFLSAEPVPIGRVIGDPTTVGEAVQLWVFEEDGGVHPWTINPHRYAIRLTAVPESQSLTLTMLAAVQLILFVGRSRHVHC